MECQLFWVYTGIDLEGGQVAKVPDNMFLTTSMLFNITHIQNQLGGKNLKSGIYRDETMGVQLMHVFNDDTQKYHSCKLQLVVETIGHS